MKNHRHHSARWIKIKINKISLVTFQLSFARKTYIRKCLLEFIAIRDPHHYVQVTKTHRHP